MTTERTKWWKAFLPKKKPGSAKDAPSSRIYEPDFDPFAQKDPAPANAKGTGDESSQSQQESNSVFGDDTYDDSLLESVFNERRTMKVSRSGRFKERRKVRSSLPIQDKDAENTAPGKEEVR